MCGIAGVLAGQIHRDHCLAVGTMVAALRHRGPEDEGFALLRANAESLHMRGDATQEDLAHLPHVRNARPGAGFIGVFGHTRLSILDLSTLGHQPMSDPGGLSTIAFNGEIFNYLELRDRLRGLGHSFRTGTDTEVLLASIRQWGVAALQHLNGMWAFALWDVAGGVLTCARDRFGVKPFYFVESGDSLWFSSEPKAMLRGGAATAVPDPDAAWDYLVLALHDHTERTFFRDVRQLPPGHFLIWRPGTRAQVGRYYHLALRDEFGRSRPEEERTRASRFLELLGDAVSLRLRSDVPVASFLSGGLDSGLVTALASSKVRGLTTFSAVYPGSALDESSQINACVTACPGIKSRLVSPPTGELLSDLDGFLECQGEPVTSAGVYAQYRLMREIRQEGFKVILGGDGADESSGGYPHLYFPHLVIDLLRHGRFLQLLREVRGVGPSDFGRFALKAAAGHLPAGIRGWALRHFYSSVWPAVACLNQDFTFSGLWREAGWNDRLMRGSLQSRLHHGVTWSNLGAVLRYADRNSMAYSVELRVPFLDHRVIEFMTQLPAVYKVRHGWNKWLVRVASAGLLPESVRWRRQKRGFGEVEANSFIPVWERLLEEGCVTTPWIDLRRLRSVGRLRFSDGYDSRRVSLWRILNYELWHREQVKTTSMSREGRRNLAQSSIHPGAIPSVEAENPRPSV